jgi:hypothetical protein
MPRLITPLAIAIVIGGICVPIIWRPVAFVIALPVFLAWQKLRG